MTHDDYIKITKRQMSLVTVIKNIIKQYDYAIITYDRHFKFTEKGIILSGRNALDHTFSLINTETKENKEYPYSYYDQYAHVKLSEFDIDSILYAMNESVINENDEHIYIYVINFAFIKKKLKHLK